MREAINVIWRLSVLAKLAVAARLLQQGLGGEYPALLTACCVLPIKSLLLMSVYRGHQDGAREFARLVEPVEWAVMAWVVFELFSQWTRSYRGIGRFGKILMATLLVGAILLSIAFWPVEWKALVFAQNFRIFYILNRVVFAALALFVVGTWCFFRNYPVAIAPNVVYHTRIAAAYFTANAVSELVFTLNGMSVLAQVNLALVTITASCFTAWAIMLTRKGQIAPPAQQVPLEDRERIERLNQELLVFMARTAQRSVVRTPPQ